MELFVEIVGCKLLGGHVQSSLKCREVGTLLANLRLDGASLGQTLAYHLGGVAVGVIDDNFGILHGFVNATLRFPFLLIHLISNGGHLEVQILSVYECLVKLVWKIDIQELKRLKHCMENRQATLQADPESSFNS